MLELDERMRVSLDTGHSVCVCGVMVSSQLSPNRVFLARVTEGPGPGQCISLI